jgi:anti-anti-sigma regulatory factor
MSTGVQDRHDGSPSLQPSETARPIASLVVRLHRDVNSCTASFSGALTATTRITIDGLAELLAGEESVVLDFSRIDVVDKHGTDAVKVLIDSVRARGTHLLMVPSHKRVQRTNSNASTTEMRD